MREVPEEQRHRARQLGDAAVAEVLRVLAANGNGKRRREVKLVVGIQDGRITADSYVEGPRSYPIDAGERMEP